MTNHTTAPTGADQQPLARLNWTDPTTLHANNYNPNHVAPPEMRLLKTSILENGWTQPVVITTDGEIVDGYHRWTLASTDPDIQKLTGGLVPTVTLPHTDHATQQMATIRHNRARGNHAVIKMADIVNTLHHDNGLPPDQIATRLQMETEEVTRLLEYGHKPTRGANPTGMNKGWTPTRNPKTT